jgi:hypothetical protein
MPAWSYDESSPPAREPSREAQVQTSMGLSDVEWSIVGMAARDSLASLHKPNRFWSLINAVFGLKPANRLANDRLESLRRIAVLAWRYRWNVPKSELRAFLEAGYSSDQYELLQNRIAQARAKRGRGN